MSARGPERRRGGRPAKPAVRPVDRLRRICLALPEANERPSHGEPTWFAGRGKVFAMLDDHHHRSPHLSVWLPLPLGAQEALVERDPARFFRPPYVGGRGWVAMILDGGPDWDEVTRLVREAYLHVATARLRARVTGAAGRALGRSRETSRGRSARPAAPSRARPAAGDAPRPGDPA